MANLQIQNITTLEDQGKALAEEWETITKGDKRRFNKSTKADGRIESRSQWWYNHKPKAS